MYAALVKSGDTSWDVFSLFNYDSMPEKAKLIDDALDSGLPIIGMETTQYKYDASNGAVWNGTSFSGGHQVDEATRADESFWLDKKKYSFISDNKIVASVIVGDDSPNSLKFAAAFSSDVMLVKIPNDQIVFVGETYGWDGTRFVAVEQ
jgi:hypothetical protein